MIKLVTYNYFNRIYWIVETREDVIIIFTRSNIYSHKNTSLVNIGTENSIRRHSILLVLP